MGTTDLGTTDLGTTDLGTTDLGTAGLREHIDDIIANHGVCLQAVLPRIPLDAHYVYTIGNLRRGLPELITFGLPDAVAAGVLNGLTERLRSGSLTPEVGVRAPGVLGDRGQYDVRLGTVAPPWARHFAPLAFSWPESDPDPTPGLLQVIVPDRRGRFWDEVGFDSAVDQVQPDLSSPTTPWRAPLVLEDDLRDHPGADVTVLLPIVTRGEASGRLEAVPAELIADDLARLVRPPVLADWVASGSVVRLTEQVGSAARASSVRRGFERVETPSHDMQLVWLLDHRDNSEAIRVLESIHRIDRMHGVTLALTPRSLHVACPPPAATAIRMQVRQLERDGIARATDLFHLGSSGCLPCPVEGTL